MTIITGTGDFQQMFQNELYEVVQVGGQNYIMPIVKLSDDSDISVNNFPSMYLITGSIASSTYIQSGTVVIYGNGFVSLLNSTYTPLGQMEFLLEQ